MTKVAVLDDWQDVARSSTDWSPLTARADVTFFNRAFSSSREVVAALADFDVILAMRERTAFPPDVKLVAGMQFMAEGPDDTHAPIWIERIEGDQVFVDSQHPLAGKTLHFDVEVLDVRKANENELSHGHPHGPDGHGHHH